MRHVKQWCWRMAAFAVAVLAPVAAHAVDGPHVTLFPWGGYTHYAKNVNLDDQPVYGGSLGLWLYRYIGIEGHFGASSTNTVNGFTLYALTPPPSPIQQDVSLMHYGGDLVVDFRPSAVISPYVMAGWQEGRFKFSNEDSVPKPRYLNGWEYGGGIKFRVTPRVAIRAEFRDALWKFPDGTPPPAGKDATDNLFFTGGIEFALGGHTGPSAGKDDDNDGVPNRRDKCPDTPAGALVDANGCPMDTDHDGVYDGIDQCPNTPQGATVDAHGCPTDSDNDGVPDGVDQCPNTPTGAVVDARGCPKDSDGDGVPDGIDQCADTPRGTTVDARGCPVVQDADHDGVPDDKDLCPNTPPNVKVDKDGCPIELNEKETELLDKGRITERNIHFETAKWDILPEDEQVLNELGKIFIQWPQLRIEIGGHCDSRGSDAYNQTLSEHRANAVHDWLLSHYTQLTAANFTAVGYGEKRPVATNKTAAGMALNRRVEFKVLNPEELTKYKERRRLLQKGE
jgi:outer membrane protein OmpA-like peptidoglycan-associated protein/opacity protein-like surface antigen